MVSQERRSRSRWLIPGVSIVAALGLALSFMYVFASTSAGAHGDFYSQTNLVSNQAGVAKNTDKNLVNAWGISFGPTTPIWVANNGTGTSTLYDGDGNPFPSAGPLVVNIPAPGGGPAGVTGTVFNPSSDDFVVSEGDKSAPSIFLFATENGSIAGWSKNLDVHNAITAVDNSASGAIYKGLTWAKWNGSDFLYATDFHNNKVDVFDANFKWVKSFTDDDVPDGYAPFGIQNLNGWIYVTFAKQDADKHDDVAGPGNGFVDVFTPGGKLDKRLISHGKLDAPWGLAWAPSDFGPFSGALLVGNFGNGWINAFDPHTGKFLGSLKDKDGNAIVIDGLWGLAFGNGALNADTNHLFFTAGPNGEADGLFGFLSFED